MSEAHASVPVLDLPRAMNLGSGKSYDPQKFNVDVNPQWQPDALVDLSQTGALDLMVDCGRFGRRLLPQAYFERIDAIDVLEHVRDLTTLMTHCLELLAIGGRMHVLVPYDLSLGAWQDPTHIRAFNQNSWLYYTEWYWYMGWEKARFDVEGLTYALSPAGLAMHEKGMPLEEIRDRPRAVDAMQVVLRKRALSEEEAAHTRARSARKS